MLIILGNYKYSGGESKVDVYHRESSIMYQAIVKCHVVSFFLPDT